MRYRFHEPCHVCEQNRTLNPDPNNYQILDFIVHEGYTLLKVHYPNITNANSVKIMLFDCSLVTLMNQRTLDPHFNEGSTSKKHPIARFSTKHWEAAKTFLCQL